MFGMFALLFATLAAFVWTFGTPNPLKQALNDSKVYEVLGEMFTKPATTQELANTPEVQQATKAAVTPDAAKQATEQFIDGTYHWLDGKTNKPDFKVDLTVPVSNFQNTLSELAKARLQSLPACTVAQLEQINPDTITVESLPCLPPGVSIDQLTQQSIGQATANNKFLQNPILTADSLPKDTNGQTAFDRAKALPDIVRLVKLLVPVTAVLAVVAAVLVFWLNRWGWRSSCKQLGASLLVSAIALILIGFLVNFVFALLKERQGGFSTTEIASAFNGFVQMLAQDVTKTTFIFGTIFLVLALAGMIVPRILKPKPVAQTSETTTV